MPWKKKPISATELPPHTTHILYIDESGDDSLPEYGQIIRNGKHDFCLSGVIMPIQTHSAALTHINKLKEKYWPPEGCVDNQKVVLHSYEMFAKKKDFSEKHINHNNFIRDLSITLDCTHMELMFFHMDKNEYRCRYGASALPPYQILVEYMIERFIYSIQQTKNPCGIIIFESRYPSGDSKILQSIHQLRRGGNWFLNQKYFKFIDGVYFNPKRPANPKLSHPGLEIADIACKVFRDTFVGEKENILFPVLEQKLRKANLFSSYLGSGFKKIP